MLAPAPASAVAGQADRPLIAFSLLVVGSALLLQRFGIPTGGKSISLVGPIGMAAAALGLLRGTLSFSRPRSVLMLGLCFCAVSGLVLHATVPSAFSAPPGMQSLLQFLVLSSFATFSFSYPVPERRFFRCVTLVLTVIAAAGLLQFLAQFAGLRLFSFRGIVPERLLYEDGYNLIIPLGIGSVFKSNGFFLVEPSVFSQMMALAIAIEVLTTRRLLHLALFAAGLLASGSGTGWLVLGSFALTSAFSLGRSGAVIALGTLAVAGIVVSTLAVLSPDVLAVMTNRLDEFSRQSTSGHLRFVTPFWVLGDVLAREPSAALFGIGAGVADRLILSYEYALNTPVKVAIDFGLPAAAAYVCLLVVGRKSPVQRALVVPCLVLLLFTGGYQQFPPVLFPVLLVLSVAWLKPDEAPAPRTGPAAAGQHRARSG